MAPTSTIVLMTSLKVCSYAELNETVSCVANDSMWACYFLSMHSDASDITASTSSDCVHIR